VLYDMVNAVLDKDCKKAVAIVDDIMTSGRDLSRFIDEMIQHLRNLLVVSTAEEADSLLDMSMENVDRLAVQAKKISAEEIIYFIREFSLISADIKYASNKRVMLEVGLIKLCSPVAKADVTALAAKVAYLEREVKNGVKTVQVVSGEAPKEKKVPKKPKPKAMSEDLEKVKAQWEDFLDSFDVVERSFLERAKIGDMEDGRLTLICESSGEKGILDHKIETIKAKLEQSFGKEFDVKTITEEEYKAWEKMTYGEAEEETDPEFESLLGAYFPEADIIE